MVGRAENYGVNSHYGLGAYGHSNAYGGGTCAIPPAAFPWCCCFCDSTLTIVPLVLCVFVSYPGHGRYPHDPMGGDVRLREEV